MSSEDSDEKGAKRTPCKDEDTQELAGRKGIEYMGICSPAYKHNPEKLEYSIYAYSSYTSNYHPRNILVSRPEVQSSRWSSESNNRAQFMTLKLDVPSIVQTITFGKYYKPHVCNLKEFKVFGGTTPDDMVELLNAGLVNDSEPETFTLKYKSKGPIFPCEYIKIVPLQTWGVNFSFSIWHVELRGTGDPGIVEKCRIEHVNEEEREAIRLCLKHLRQRNYIEPFNSLQRATNVVLEDILLSELYDRLVIHGNFEMVENILKSASEKGLLDEYTEGDEYNVVWRRITQDDGEAPCVRGGHQMCINPSNGAIYMFGGWDGFTDLADLWTYDPDTQRWRCISRDTSEQGGPGPRSCHKICIDPIYNRIYILGRYLENVDHSLSAVDSDFWRYDITEDRWTILSKNTANENGPGLLYNHQMVVDPEKQKIYVFGGKIAGDGAGSDTYSGLYCYSIETATWRLVFSDVSQSKTSIRILSRIGHSMLFNPKSRELYIFAGQRYKDGLADFYVFDIDSEKLYTISRDYTKQGGPDAGFTHRSVINTNNEYIYALSGLTRGNCQSSKESFRNVVWTYDLKTDTWKKVYQGKRFPNDSEEPIPRFAHQLVYNPINSCLYLFGGNPGEDGNDQLRLDDFWELLLKKYDVSDILARAIFKIRSEKFKEMCNARYPNHDSIEALHYLRLKVCEMAPCANKSKDPQFQDLILDLLKPSDQLRPSSVNNFLNTYEDKSFDELMRPSRVELYESLLEYFPAKLKQPKANLIDLIRFT